MELHHTVATTTGDNLASHNASTHGSTHPLPHYHTFLCHSGETKGEFITGLYGHIKRAGMTPFMAAKDINLADDNVEILDTLDQAVRNSDVIVVIVFPSFFKSKQCMRQLHLAKCLGKPILPVFYNVEPSACKEVARRASAMWGVPEDLKEEWLTTAQSVGTWPGTRRKTFDEDNEALSVETVKWLKKHFSAPLMP